MSPPRRPPTGGADLSEILLEKMTHLERELSDVKEMIANRLTAVEAATAKVTRLEERVAELEKVRAQAEGAAMFGKVVWAGLLALGTGIGWLASRFWGHP